MDLDADRTHSKETQGWFWNEPSCLQENEGKSICFHLKGFTDMIVDTFQTLVFCLHPENSSMNQLLSYKLIGPIIDTTTTKLFRSTYFHYSNPIDQMWDSEKSIIALPPFPRCPSLPQAPRPSCQSKSSFHWQSQVVLPECGYPSWSHPTSSEAAVCYQKKVTKLLSLQEIPSYQGLETTEFQWSWLYRSSVESHRCTGDPTLISSDQYVNMEV